MGKKKKQKEQQYAYETDNTFRDPDAFNAFLDELIAEGELPGPRSAGYQIPPMPMPPVQRDYTLQSPSRKTKPTHQSSLPGFVNPQETQKTGTKQSLLPRVAPYGRLFVERQDTLYGPALAFYDAYGNSVVRPISTFNYHDVDMTDDDTRETILCIYQLVKLAMFPDAIYGNNPDDVNRFMQLMGRVNIDNVLNFMDDSRISSYIIDMTFVAKAIVPKVVNIIKEVGGNVLATMMQFLSVIPGFQQSYPGVVYLCDGVKPCEAEAQYLLRYCKVAEGYQNVLTDLYDMLDDYNSICESLVNEVSNTVEYYMYPTEETDMATETPDVSEDPGFDPYQNVGNTSANMIDPNLMTAMQPAEGRYPCATQTEGGGATNDDSPFPLDTSDIVTVCKTETTEITVTGGKDLSEAGISESVSRDCGLPDKVSDSDVTVDRPIQQGTNADGAVRGSVSTECTTNLGNILENALAKAAKSAPSTNGGNTSRSNAGGEQTKATKEGSVGVQSGGTVTEEQTEKEEKRKEEKDGSMVINVTTCGR